VCVSVREPDADELAVLADPEPWSWDRVKFHRLGSYRLKLHKTAVTRRAETKYERLQPVIVTERYFPYDAEGTAAFKEAKWVRDTRA
jgi:hypothetical protein